MALGSRIPRPMRLWLIVAALVAFVWFLSHPLPQDYKNPRKFLQTAKGLGGLYGSPPTNQDIKSGNTASFSSDSKHPLPGSNEALDFWKKYGDALIKANTTFEKVRNKDVLEGWPMVPYEGVNPWSDRVDRLNMSDAEVSELKEKHTAARQTFKDISPSLPFVRGTRGIVVTTSVEAMGFLTVSLRMLRKTGSTLPVEIWFYDRKVFAVDPYALQMCEHIWAPLNAVCRFTEDYMPKERPAPLDKETVVFQNKINAMLFSTFEQFLFLDSDCFPIMSIDNLFDEEPFKSNGVVLWPDYWADTSSHYYYELAGLEAEHLMTRASSESGQLMLNKNTHAEALLLASYYVHYGQHYFQLFTQGAMGMGDKECYLRAIKAYNLTFYQVNERPERLGYRCDGQERAVASGQHHPRDDLLLLQHGINRGRNSNLLSDGTTPRILFIHGNLPKYDPCRYLDWYNEEIWPDQLRCDKGKGKAHRMYGSRKLQELKFGWDVEKAIWDQMYWVSCETEEYQVSWWNGTDYNNWKKRPGVCRDMKKFYHELLTEPEGLHYDGSLTNPYLKGGLFEQNLQNNIDGGWDHVRTGSRWW